MVKECGEKLSSALWQLRQAGTFCDTVVTVRGNMQLTAHAVVLAAASTSLCSLLQQNHSDDHPPCQYRVDVIDYDVDTVAAFLEFIYTGEVVAFASLSCCNKDDVTGLCAKFGVTVTADDYFTGNSRAAESCKNITDCHLTESTTSSHCNSTLAEGHTNASVKVNSPVMRTRSATVKRQRRKQICGKTQPVIDQLLSGSDCNQTCSTHVDHLLKQDSDQTETVNCPTCKHPCTEVDKAAVDSEVAVKIDNDCSTVDASQLRPEPTDVSTADQKQGIQQKGTRMSTSVESKTSCKWHQCPVCLRHFPAAAALKGHKKVHVERSCRSTAVSCRTCGKKFRNRSYLRYHERLHDGEGHPFICDVCGKGFVCKSNLATHYRTHTGDRRYECSVCHKRFFQLCSVHEHEKIHIGIKMFVCDICGKQFMTYAQLYNHSRTHGGDKPFECVACKKRFYTNGDLVKHARIHADRRPFVCDVCGKGFKYSSNLHGHARIHTGSRPFSCKTCGKAFTYSSHLSRHAKMHARNTVVLEETTATTASKEELQSQSIIAQSSTDNIVGMASSAPSAVLLVQPFFI